MWFVHKIIIIGEDFFTLFCLPFGLNDAPGTQHSLMEECLCGLQIFKTMTQTRLA